MATAYQTNDTPGYHNCVSAESWAKQHNNFLGPPCTAGENSPGARNIAFQAADFSSVELADREFALYYRHAESPATDPKFEKYATAQNDQDKY
jgi:hypothetical protein